MDGVNWLSPVTLAHSKEWRSYKLMKMGEIRDYSVYSVSFESTSSGSVRETELRSRIGTEESD